MWGFEWEMCSGSQKARSKLGDASARKMVMLSEIEWEKRLERTSRRALGTPW